MRMQQFRGVVQHVSRRLVADVTSFSIERHNKTQQNAWRCGGAHCQQRWIRGAQRYFAEFRSQLISLNHNNDLLVSSTSSRLTDTSEEFSQKRGCLFNFIVIFSRLSIIIFWRHTSIFSTENLTELTAWFWRMISRVETSFRCIFSKNCEPSKRLFEPRMTFDFRGSSICCDYFTQPVQEYQFDLSFSVTPLCVLKNVFRGLASFPLPQDHQCRMAWS